LAVGNVESQCDGYAARASADVENSAIGNPNRRMLCDEATQVLCFWSWNQDAGLYMESASAEVGLPQDVLHGLVFYQPFCDFFQFCLAV
jgi:hypothetical protein